MYGYWFAQDLLTNSVIEDFKAEIPNYFRMKTDNHLTDRIVTGQYYMGNHITAMERERLIAYVADRYPIDVYTRSSTDGIKKQTAAEDVRRSQKCRSSFMRAG